jgi:outer membrane protein
MARIRIPYQRPVLIALSGLTLGLPVHAQSLLELYQAAQGYDASYQAVQAQFDATSAKSEQVQAQYAPVVSLQGSLKQDWLKSQSYTDSADYTTQKYETDGTLSLGFTQTLYSKLNELALTSAQRSAALVELSLVAARQDLMVRVSSAYFDVLAARDSLEFVQAQKSAVAQQLAAAKRNFEVGTSTITDTREAQAKFDLVIAQEISAQNDLTVKTSQLEQLVGRSNLKPQGIRLPLQMPAVLGTDSEWAALTEQYQPQIQSKRTELELAKLETDKARADSSPTVSLTGSLGKVFPWGGSSTANDTAGTSTFTHSRDSQSASMGVVVNIPLFTGTTRAAKLRETLALEDKTRNDLEALKRNAQQTTRTVYYGVQSLAGQVKAYEAAEASSQSALDANKLGYEVGVRINIDVLNAQSQLYETKAKLAKARYDVLVSNLKLRQSAGTLAESNVQEIDSLLIK